MPLADLIRERINQQGSMSFRDFMEMALYHPTNGYYTSSENIIGTDGDFFTSPGLTPAFGFTVAKYLQEMWIQTGTDNFTIVEFGAGTGILCNDILTFFKTRTDRYDRLNYVIVERSKAMRSKEQTLLKEKVKWVSDLGELGNFCGCVLSNELLDNFSVHRVVMLDKLMEINVDYQHGFAEKLVPTDDKLILYFSDLGVTLPYGYQTEANLEAIEWMEDINIYLKKGFILTIDYGNLSEQLYKKSRREGTLLCYYKHSMNDDPYINIGSQDITIHVNFSALIQYGGKMGLEPVTFIEQGNFLIAGGFKTLLLELLGTGENVFQLARKEATISRLLLFEMGQQIKVLIQSKNIASPGFFKLPLLAV